MAGTEEERESRVKVGGGRARSGGLVQKHRSQLTVTWTRVEHWGHTKWLDDGHILRGAPEGFSDGLDVE